MSSKQIQISEVGTIQLVKSFRARNISITVKPFEDVRVSVPNRISYTVAENLVRKKIDWIKKHQNRLKNVEQKKTIFDENTDFRTKYHRLIINKNDNNENSSEISGGEIRVFYPQKLNVKNESVQLFIRRVIEEALRIEAKQYIPLKVQELAEKYKFTYRKVFIKNIKSRWGSCSKIGNVNFSLHLMLLPADLIDYVILHELAHTIEHNHSKNFWAILDDIYGNAKTIDRKLKNYRIGIW